MEKSGVLFEVRTEFLNTRIIYTSYQNFAPSSLPHIKIKTSPYADLPRFTVWIQGSHWVQWTPAQLLYLLHLSSIPSSQPNVIPPLQPNFTRRTSGHCLGTFVALNLALPPILNVVSHTTHPLYLLKTLKCWSLLLELGERIVWEVRSGTKSTFGMAPEPE
jgi:hypothetical protein